MTRRDLLTLAVAAPVGSFLIQRPGAVLDARGLNATRAAALGLDGAPLEGVDVLRPWSGAFCRPRVVSRRGDAVRVKEVVLFDVDPGLPESSQLYGEGFQMLSQTGGTFGAPVALGNYTDASHYKIPAGAGAQAVYGMLSLTGFDGVAHTLAFTSAARFVGRFEVTSPRLRTIVDTEGLELAPGAEWPLEEFTVASGERTALLTRVAARLRFNHPPLKTAAPPAGWCSWYCFGANVTAKNVLDNLDVITREIPSLKYIQIDDGYQSAMGDWLDTGTAFGGNVRTVLDEIKRRGFEPAIWVAPFIAEAGSRVFQQHPDWFVQDSAGRPLRADTVTFGGWRRGPWYALDGTHPAVQQHFEQLFRTMRDEWGCTYFKLDANFWGAIHGGRFHDARATRVEAYRRGMQAIVRGARDAFILGCNHPIWPSIGVIHGSRSSNDIKRAWDRIATTARQNLHRNWQNGELWWNDPDAVCLSGDLPDNEFQFHASAIYASGGMVLSGDDLTSIPAPRLAMLRKLLPPTGVAAKFEDATLRVGVVDLKTARVYCVFNFDDTPSTAHVRLARTGTLTDIWTGTSAPQRDLALQLELPARSARLLKLTT